MRAALQGGGRTAASHWLMEKLESHWLPDQKQGSGWSGQEVVFAWWWLRLLSGQLQGWLPVKMGTETKFYWQWGYFHLHSFNEMLSSLYYCILNFWAKLLREYFSLPIRLFTLALRLLWFPLLTLVNNLITNMWIYALPEFALRKKKLGKRPRHWNLQYAKYKA